MDTHNVNHEDNRTIFFPCQGAVIHPEIHHGEREMPDLSTVFTVHRFLDIYPFEITYSISDDEMTKTTQQIREETEKNPAKELEIC